MNVQECLVALNMVPGLGAVKIHRLIAAMGGPENIFAVPGSRLETVEGIGTAIAASIERLSDGKAVAEEFRLARELGVTLHFFGGTDYPELLKEIYDPPVVLYARGVIVPEDRKSIAVVGTRAPSVYGKTQAKKISGELARAGWTIVSGLARGVDAQVHWGALESGGRTLAVLGTGLAKLYPPEHGELAERIAGQGALLSEFPLTTDPLPQNFPRRNRIISGLAAGTVVIEGPKTSGALITAHWAVEQGREVFALPGMAGVRNTEGPHSLIKNGAKLVDNVGDILEELGPLSGTAENVHSKECRRERVPLRADEQQVFDAFEDAPLHIDELCRATGMIIPQLSSLLMVLELNGYVQQLGGKTFVKIP